MDRSVVETGFLGPSPPRKIVRVSITAPLTWIKGGIGDFLQAPLLSLFFGGVHAALVVLPPQVAIVGAGRIRDSVVARDGKPMVRPVLPLSLTFDHRGVMGGEASRFLAAVKADLEIAN